MFLRRDFLDAWIVAASGSTNVDPDQCCDGVVPVPYQTRWPFCLLISPRAGADVISPGESADLGRDDRNSGGLLTPLRVCDRLALILKHANKNRPWAPSTGVQTISMYAKATAVSSATREQAIADFKSFPRGCQTTAGYPFSYAVSAGKTKRTENQNCSKHHAQFLNC